MHSRVKFLIKKKKIKKNPPFFPLSFLGMSNSAEIRGEISCPMYSYEELICKYLSMRYLRLKICKQH